MPTTSLYYCKLFPIFTSLHAFISITQGFQFSQIIRETPDFEPFLPVSRFRVWNLADDRRSLPFFVDSTFWQLNFKHFALFELLLTSNVSSETPVCHSNVSSNVRKPRGSSDFRLPTSDFRLQTSAFRRQTSDLRLYNSNFRLQTWQSSNSGFLISDRWDSMLHG